MPDMLKTTILIFTIAVCVTSQTATADEPSQAVAREMLFSGVLPNVSDRKLTAVTVEFSPGVTVPAHKHEAFVFVYVLEGIIRSQLDDGEIVEYKAGESWVEPPGITHSLIQNPSETEHAKLLAVFIAQEGAKLTTSGDISH